MENSKKIKDKIIEIYEILRSMEELLPEDEKIHSNYTNLFLNMGNLSLALGNYYLNKHKSEKNTH